MTWGPAPVLVALVPLHLFGFEPSAGFTVSLFSAMGLAFVLMTLRIVLRRIGDIPVWMCVLAAFTLALASTVPFMLRRPAVYEEAISGGYCFVMAGIWLSIKTLVERGSSLRRLVLMSLCFGLAIGSRPTLALPAVLLVLVYLALRTSRPRRSLVAALVLPIGVCVALLLAYNQARFGNPLEEGVRYQLAGVDPRTAPFYDLGYVPPGLWFYGLSPPRISALFPFIVLRPSPVAYPGTLSALYTANLESTGGLLPMAPIAVFGVALPWMFRRRSTSLGELSLPLLTLAVAGAACMLFLSYVFFATTERYAVDFTTLLLIGAVVSWLTLSRDARGWKRRVVCIGGAVLATWSCIAGFAISFTGYDNLLANAHPGTWRTLQDITSPLSSLIGAFAGHPMLGEINGSGLMGVGEGVEVVVVSPGERTANLLVVWAPVVRDGEMIVGGSHASQVVVHGPGHTRMTYRVPVGGDEGIIPVHLGSGVNRVTLIHVAARAGASGAANASQELLYVKSISLARE